MNAFRDSIPVMMGYLAMGFAAGALLAVEGGIPYAPVWAFASSAAFESGPLQYLFVDWVRAAMPLGGVLLVTLCVNFRYSLYGLSLIDRFRGAGFWKKAYLIGTITDETYALQTACRLPGKEGLGYCMTLAVLDPLYWIGGVTAGATAGTLAKSVFSPEKVEAATKGIDFAMTALFLVILTDQLRERANRAPALVGFAASVAAALVFGRANMLVPSVLAILASFFALRRWLDGR